MKYLQPFGQFINESGFVYMNADSSSSDKKSLAADSGLVKISIEFEYEGEIQPAVEGILSLEYPEDKRFLIKGEDEDGEDMDGDDFNEAIEWILEFFQEKNILPPYTVDQLEDPELGDYMTSVYKDRTADDRSRIHLEVEGFALQDVKGIIDFKEIVDIKNPEFRRKMLGLLGYELDDTEFLTKVRDYGLL